MKVLFLVPLLVALVSAEGPVAGEENPLELNDIVISSNTVGGDINVNGGDSGRGNGGNGQWGGEEEEGGDDSFEDGCSVVGSTVHECDGTQRLLTKVEKKKVTARLARRQRARKNNSKKPARNQRSNRSRTAKSRRDVDVDGESPCKTCATGASFHRKH